MFANLTTIKFPFKEDVGGRANFDCNQNNFVFLNCYPSKGRRGVLIEMSLSIVIGITLNNKIAILAEEGGVC